MIRVPTIFDFDQGNRKQMQIEAAHYKRPAASRRPGPSRNWTTALSLTKNE
jgi:hypothetical protein